MFVVRTLCLCFIACFLALHIGFFLYAPMLKPSLNYVIVAFGLVPLVIGVALVAGIRCAKRVWQQSVAGQRKPVVRAAVIPATLFLFLIAAYAYATQIGFAQIYDDFELPLGPLTNLITANPIPGIVFLPPLLCGFAMFVFAKRADAVPALWFVGVCTTLGASAALAFCLVMGLPMVSLITNLAQ